jgi:hypothetical protein
MYVGKAGGKSGLRDRFVHHYAKAFGIEQSGTTHTGGWVFYRGETNSMDWDPDSWEIEYFEVSKEVHRTYLEASMILMFDPLCNDESFKDRHHEA